MATTSKTFYEPLTESERRILDIAKSDSHGVVRTGGCWSIRSVCLSLVRRGLMVRMNYTDFCLSD